jgi:lysophospholipase L1-like esterase
MHPLPIRVALGVTLCTAIVAAQSPAGSASPVELQRRIDAYRHLLSDWAGLTRYGSDDSEIPPPSAGENRVVFIGDEVTESWPAAQLFVGKPYFNRGIRGQASPQMLVRFRQDVIALKPRVVVIAAGLNDLAGAAGPGTRGTLGDNLTSMTELASYNGITVVLASITPICDCYKEQTALRSQVRLSDFNEWIRQYASRSGAVYLDYYSALADGRDFRKELTSDGVLPNARGYAVMAPLAEKAIARALAH